MSLRTIHLLFILTAIIGADLFGAWAVWNFRHTRDAFTLCLGIAAVLGGLGLIWYAFRFVAKFDKAKIH